MPNEWAPVYRTHDGIEEIGPDWVSANSDRLQIVDVREHEEFTGPLGHIGGAALIPLGTLPAELARIDTSRPVVTVCHSGGRSARAYLFLKQAGYERVANMTGGMLGWHALGLPVKREAPD